MQITVLAVKETHGDHQECPMRLAWHPNWQCWYCVDCGLAIMAKRIEIKEIEENIGIDLETERKSRAKEKSDIGLWEKSCVKK
jgi:hypothetical protein